MNISPETSNKIIKLIEVFINHPQDQTHTRELQISAAKYSLLPLVFNWHPCCVNPQGEIFLLNWDDLDNPQREYNKRIINGILFQGIKQYPELIELMPKRSESDEDCSHCDGTGIDPIGKEVNLPEKIICWCGGLGWIPKVLK